MTSPSETSSIGFTVSFTAEESLPSSEDDVTEESEQVSEPGTEEESDFLKEPEAAAEPEAEEVTPIPEEYQYEDPQE